MTEIPKRMNILVCILNFFSFGIFVISFWIYPKVQLLKQHQLSIWMCGLLPSSISKWNSLCDSGFFCIVLTKSRKVFISAQKRSSSMSSPLSLSSWSTACWVPTGCPNSGGLLIVKLNKWYWVSYFREWFVFTRGVLESGKWTLSEIQSCTMS